MDKFGCPSSIFINYQLSIIHYSKGFKRKYENRQVNLGCDWQRLFYKFGSTETVSLFKPAAKCIKRQEKQTNSLFYVSFFNFNNFLSTA